MKNTILGLALCVVWPVFAQQKAMVTVHPQQGTQVINKEIYGQFAAYKENTVPIETKTE